MLKLANKSRLLVGGVFLLRPGGLGASYGFGVWPFRAGNWTPRPGRQEPRDEAHAMEAKKHLEPQVVLARTLDASIRKPCSTSTPTRATASRACPSSMKRSSRNRKSAVLLSGESTTPNPPLQGRPGEDPRRQPQGLPAPATRPPAPATDPTLAGTSRGFDLKKMG